MVMTNEGVRATGPALLPNPFPSQSPVHGQPGDIVTLFWHETGEPICWYWCENDQWHRAESAADCLAQSERVKGTYGPAY